MKAVKYIVLLLAVVAFSSPAIAQEATEVVKTIALGDVDVGQSTGGQKAYDVKETVQILVKRELEKIGKGRYNVKITSPAVVIEGAAPKASTMPTLSSGRTPTQKEMMQYMAQMQQWQNQASGKVKVHKPVVADVFVEFRISNSKGGTDVGGAASTISRFTGVNTSFANLSTKSSKMYLICTMRDPASGALIDRYNAKASSVKIRNLAGYTSYDYGDDEITRENLFKRAARKCAKWIKSKVQ